MPGPTLTPPGAIDQHVTLMALTPALLAGATAIATSVLGSRRAARMFATVGLSGALALQALFLRPHGAASAYPQPVGLGLVRIGWVPSGLALVLGGWAALRWWPPAARTPLWGWCARVALALALPVAQLPVLALGCERDLSPAAARRRTWRAAVLAAATAIAALVGPRLAMGCSLAVAAALIDGPWRPALIVCALAELAPP